MNLPELWEPSRGSGNFSQLFIIPPRFAAVWGCRRMGLVRSQGNRQQGPIQDVGCIACRNHRHQAPHQDGFQWRVAVTTVAIAVFAMCNATTNSKRFPWAFAEWDGLHEHVLLVVVCFTWVIGAFINRICWINHGDSKQVVPEPFMSGRFIFSNRGCPWPTPRYPGYPDPRSTRQVLRRHPVNRIRGIRSGAPGTGP